LVQLSPLYFLGDVLYSGTKLNAETTLMIGAFILGCAALLELNRQREDSFWAPTMVAALGCAIGVSAKMNFMPLLIVPLIILPRMKWRLLFVLCFVVMLALVLVPVLGAYRSLAERFMAYFLKTGVHASGRSGLLPDNAWPSLRTLMIINAPAYSMVGLGLFVWVVTAMWSLWRPDLRRCMALRVVTGLLVVFVLQTLAVLRTPLSYYLVPVLALAGVMLVSSLWLIVAWDPRRRWFAYAGAGLLGIAGVVMSARFFSAHALRMYASFEQQQRTARARTTLTEKMKPHEIVVFCKSIATPESALHFGNSTCGSLFHATLSNLYPRTYFYHPWGRMYCSWSGIVPFAALVQQTSNIALAGRANYGQDRPPEPWHTALQREEVSLYRLDADDAVHLAGLAASTNMAAWWMDVWRPDAQLADATRVTSLLAYVTVMPAYWRLFTNSMAHADGATATAAFVAWRAASNMVDRGVAISNLAHAVTMRTWPYYVYAVQQMPTGMPNYCVIPWSALAQRGVAVEALRDASLQWLSQYYASYAGMDTALAYWEYIKAQRPALAAMAVINQVLLEQEHGHPDKAVERIRQQAQLLGSVPWVRARALSILTSNSTPAARDVQRLLEQYAPTSF
jgi:hypothetical protein